MVDLLASVRFGVVDEADRVLPDKMTIYNYCHAIDKNQFVDDGKIDIELQLFPKNNLTFKSWPGSEACN